MKRSPSSVAQFAFDSADRMSRLATYPKLIVRLFAQVGAKVARLLLRRAGAHHTVDAYLYGRWLRMPAEHPLSLALLQYPQYNRPLTLAIKALTTSSAYKGPITVIDVGANIGETIAVIEQLNPGICSYLCIEADQDIAEICKFNHRGNSRVQTEQRFIGENEGSLVRLEDDGRANPSTKLLTETEPEKVSQYDRLVRLDTIATPFAEAHGSVTLIKVDTEGYDFSVLRSGPELLNRYKPAVYFEWYPALLTDLNEEVWDGFDYLERFGYSHFVFFSNRGDYYCKISKPNRFLLHSLAGATYQNRDLPYFDVFASTDEAVCDEVIKLSIATDAR